MKNSRSAAWLCTFIWVLLASGGMGCAVAALGGGAAGGVAYSDRGAQADVKGNVNQVAKNTQEVFQKMGIQSTGTQMKNSGSERDLDGKSGNNNVSVQITSTGPQSSHVEVISKDGTLSWNKDYAKQVVERIVAS